MSSHSSEGLVGAGWYAVGSFFAVPLVVLGMILSAVLLLLTWPFVPVLCYLKRREEICLAKIEDEKSKTPYIDEP